ncbi:hypothetical protein K466DRAFT_155768 [Polyporus arcularius HHB13444]|uniref:Uncharacterized protein n=1 Tax=Polyporus arcularius HHB13444 TaxID=1314778 RepID=A0A5C3PK65_9APHY|nr:hypothetical protein K466DRAFT_155768 [Polyporus arcularius HHB13444]
MSRQTSRNPSQNSGTPQPDASSSEWCVPFLSHRRQLTTEKIFPTAPPRVQSSPRRHRRERGHIPDRPGLAAQAVARPSRSRRTERADPGLPRAHRPRAGRGLVRLALARLQGPRVRDTKPQPGGDAR